MALTRMKSEEVTFPLSVFETADTKEDLEDWLLSQNPEFIKRMRKARREDILVKGKNWGSLKRELCIK
jgi:3-isopropylmalate dehydratase small subunit